MTMKRRNQLYWANWAKADPYDDENAIDFRWSSVNEGDEEDIALANFIENLQKQNDEDIFKKVTGWLFDDCGFVPNEKKLRRSFYK